MNRPPCSLNIVGLGLAASILLYNGQAVAQQTRERIDLVAYQSIRDEGFYGSHIMEYASALTDGIGPRLTGSPNLRKAADWARAQFAAMGLANARVEPWGEFGIGWEQHHVWVRMVEPDRAVFIAQAAPWSPPTPGPVTASVVLVTLKEEQDFARYRGTLAGKIVLLGEPNTYPPDETPLFQPSDEARLAERTEYRLTNSRRRYSSDDPDKQYLFGNHVWVDIFKQKAFQEQIGASWRLSRSSP